MGDEPISDGPDDVPAGHGAEPQRWVWSCRDYSRQRVTDDARASRVPVTHDDLHRFGQAVAGLADDHLMRQAWQ